MKSDSFIAKFVSVNPAVCHGKPCLAGTRVMVYQILEHIEAGESVKEIQRHYPRLTPNHIRAALRYAAAVVKQRDYIPFDEAS